MALYPDISLFPSEDLFPQAVIGKKPIQVVSEIDHSILSQSHTVATLVEIMEQGEPVHSVVGEAIDPDDSIRLGQGGTVDGSVSITAGAGSRSRLSLNMVDDGSGRLIMGSAASVLSPEDHELRASRGVELIDQILLVRLGIFGITRATSSDDGVTSVEGLDRSGRLIDAKLEAPFTVSSGTPANDAILSMLAFIGYNGPTDFATATVPLPALIANEGDDGWDFCQGIAESVGGELYFNRVGVPTMRPIPRPSSESLVAATVSEGEGGVMLGIERAWDRDPVHNRVIVTGENPTNPDGPVPRAVATDDNPNSPTYYFGPFGRKPFFWNSKYISSNTQAEDAAEGKLAKTMGAPDILSFESVVNPALDPSHVVEVHRSQLQIEHERHVLDDVSIPLGSAGTQAAKTRAVIAQ